ncbi:unnamed protein product [Arabis nemorensis]|uniref:Uncharacterized protein n=1 Tax=Arabis nemorensis TaxID=586526 RepID=A0A565AXI2_9BRAS|nr:unnamed protein product [Arabis nemorensis]
MGLDSSISSSAAATSTTESEVDGASSAEASARSRRRTGNHRDLVNRCFNRQKKKIDDNR